MRAEDGGWLCLNYWHGADEFGHVLPCELELLYAHLERGVLLHN